VTSAPATETTSTELVPTFDFSKAISVLEKDESVNLSDVLAQLATIPVVAPPAVKKKVDKDAVARKLEEDRATLTALPDAFGVVEEPASRRLLSKAELAQAMKEKTALSEAKKAVTAREAKLNEWLSTHFDVYAEKLNLVDPEKTPKDAKGHYLIGAMGNRLEQAVEGADKIFTREKDADKAPMSHELLLAAFEDGKITRAEYLAFTTTVRVLDEKKIRTAMLSKARRERAQEIIAMITQVKPGRLSVHVR
jgi:hypothetical protein